MKEPTQEWLRLDQALAELGVAQSTLAYYVNLSRVRVRIPRNGRGRIYHADDIADLAQIIAARRERRRLRKLTKDEHNLITQRALWRLRELHPEEYRRLREEELLKEFPELRGSPAPTEDPPPHVTSPSKRQECR